MLIRALTSTMALLPLAVAASTKTNVPPSPDGSGSTPEGVVVSAPEPRYVAPTLRDQIGRVWAPVYINGRGPFRLVLDTGANSSAVIASLASRIGAPIVPNALKLHGVTGSSLVPAIHVDSVEVGDLWLGNRQLAVVQDVFGGAEGVLGADGLRDMRVFIDFRHDRISIRRSGPTAFSARYTRVPISLKADHLLTFNVKVAGVRTKALLDTGAQRTIGNRALQAALERKARRGVASSIIGVTLDVQQGDTFSAPPVRIKDITIRGMHITFGDMYIFDAWDMTEEPALLIGMDIIGLLDSLIIDYKREELYLRARR
ncbi:MAG TPA: retroviral-like aspartic protease family protein [Steroidobacter sp.]